MPLGISKTTVAYLLAWKETFSYSPLVLCGYHCRIFSERGYFS